MLKGKYIYYILGIMIVAALFLKVISFFDTNNLQPVKEETAKNVSNIIDQENVPLKTATTTEQIWPVTISTTTEQIENKAEVIINSPQPGEVISSPLVISGLAKGSWFFEATLPIKLLDDKGQTITATFAQAESDWMTSDLVPFKALLDFKTKATSGYLLIAKDNPSGLAEHDASVRISVNFLNK